MPLIAGFGSTNKVANGFNREMWKGYFSENPTQLRGQFFLSGFVLFFIGSIIPFANIGLILSAVLLCAFAWFMPKMTEKGARTREQILGFKEYLSVAEKDRIDFVNAPEKNPTIFEKLLPYAVALGVEKNWAEVFQNVYTEKTKNTWYQGSAPLNAVDLTHELKVFESSANTAIASSSGVGGLSGGSSGGGAGGGGGGTW